MTGALIEAQGLGKSYGVHRVLRGIGLAVGERELVCDKLFVAGGGHFGR
jgi:hypothetical protein